ncbi:MAG: glycosyltransferase [Deltaproteobacteria bacterium]
MRPRVSVLMPTLNCDAHLRETLASLGAQTLAPGAVEHLAIDAGSRDDTLAMLAAAPRPVRVISAPGRNIYASMNDGLAQAQGDVIAGLNADDLFAPDALARALETFDADASVDMVVAHYEMFRDVRGARRAWRYDTDGRELERIARGDFSRWFEIWVNPLAVFFRRGLLERMGGFRTDAPLVGDWDLWFRLAASAVPVRVAHTGRVAGSFRMHAGSLTASADPTRLFRDKLFVMGRFAGDPGVPAGVRRSALRMYRHDALGLAAHEASTLSFPQSAAHVVRAALDTRSRGSRWARDLTSGLPTLTYEALSRVPGVRRLTSRAWAWSGGPREASG